MLIGLLLPTLAAAQGEGKRVSAELETYSQAQVATGRFMGAVRITRGDEILFERAYGSANLELDVPNQSETVFRIGSLTKQFTAAAVLQLQEQGKLNVSDTLECFLPDYPGGDAIMLHQLLSHTGGVPELLTLPAVADNATRAFTLDALIATFKDLPLDFAPGSRYSYSNSGYVLLSKVIEVVSGQFYADYLRAHMFEPLNMTHTAYDDSKPVVEKRASGYVYLGRDYANADYVDLSIPTGAGALHSTVGDLHLWNQALLEPTLITDASRNAMIAPVVPTDPAQDNEFYGYGLFSTRLHGRAFVGHNGGIDGFSAALGTYPEDDLEIIVLLNVQDVDALGIVYDLGAVVHGDPYALPEVRTPLNVDAATLVRYAGRYVLEPDFDVTVFSKEDRLYVQPVGSDPFELFPEGDNAFYLSVIDAEVTFTVDAAGTVTGLNFKDNEAGGEAVAVPKVPATGN